MDSVKKFVKEHKKELGLTAAGIFIYRMGYKTGYGSAINAIRAVVNEALTVTKF